MENDVLNTLQQLSKIGESHGITLNYTDMKFFLEIETLTKSYGIMDSDNHSYIQFSRDELSKKTCLSKTTVQKCIYKLKKCNLLHEVSERNFRSNENGEYNINLPNKIYINFDSIHFYHQ